MASFTVMRVAFCGTLCLALASAQRPSPRELGSFRQRHAGFVRVFPKTDFSGARASLYDLFLTTFDALALFVYDDVYTIREPGLYLDFVNEWGDFLEELGPAAAYWPNDVTQVPRDLAGFDGILQSSGFIPPGKQDGAMQVYNTEANPPLGPWNIASLDSQSYSYHQGTWKDIDGDGLVDLLAGRFHVNLIGDPTSELVWFKNPGGLTQNGDNFEGWQQNILLEGPDVYLDYQEWEADGQLYEVLIAGELWTKRVMIYYVPSGPGAWADPENIMSVVVDQASGTPFQASAYDLNLDGKPEIVCSTFIDQQENGGELWAYMMPDDFRTPNWNRISLASGFTPNGYRPDNTGNKISPGSHRVFYPSEDYNADGTKKPFISLSGDDDGKHYILYPVNDDPSDFSYDIEVLVDTEADTSGTQAIADLDGDGFVEIISTGYSAGRVYVHTFDS